MTVVRRDRRDVTAAVETARECLALSQGLLPVRDVTGRAVVPPTGAGSRPPWNAGAAYAHFVLRETIVRLEVSLLNTLEGEQSRPRRGGSDGNASSALRSVGVLANRLEPGEADRVARILWRAAGPTESLPAVDRVTRWVPIRACDCREDCEHQPPKCPYCGTYSLRVAEGAYSVICQGWKRELDVEGRWQTVPCTDEDGNRPFGTLEISLIPGEFGKPVLAFRDGLVVGPLTLGGWCSGVDGGGGVCVA